ncbi:S-adenosyl-L-methionine-dependent methyltransferase, partial [Patellaria atrata CBS 101060]
MKAMFEELADNYDKESGGICADVAKQFLPLLPPITSSSVVHDNACGTGGVTEVILNSQDWKGELPRIYGTDIAEGMLKQFDAKIEKNGWGERVTTQAMEGSDLSALPDSTFTHSICNMGYFAFKDGIAGAKHMYRTLAPGGVLVVTGWSKPRTVELAHLTQKVVRPDEPVCWPLSEDWKNPKKGMGALAEGGFKEDNMEVKYFTATGDVGSGETIIGAMTHGFGRMFRQGYSEEETERWREAMRGFLTDEEKN